MKLWYISLKSYNAIYFAEDKVFCNENNDYYSLTRDEIGTIYLYTSELDRQNYAMGENLYYKLNRCLREKLGNLNLFLPFVNLILSAISKIPKQTVLVYRGIYGVNLKGKTKDYKVGNRVTWWQFNSCSEDLSVAKTFFGQEDHHTLFHIQTDYAHPISQFSMHSKETEYMILPGAEFEVTKIIDSEYIYVIYLHQKKAHFCYIHI